MATIFDGQTKEILSDRGTSKYIGDFRYAIDPVFPIGVPYHHLNVIPGTKLFKGITIDTGVVEEMSTAEKDVVNATTLSGAKADKRQSLQTIFWTAIRGRYPVDNHTMLMTLFIVAKTGSMPNRAAYVSPLFAWMETAISALFTAISSVNAITYSGDIDVDLASVAAVTIDTAAIVAADPGVTIQGAIAILD